VSKYGNDVKLAIVRTLLDSFNKGVPHRLDALGIGRVETTHWTDKVQVKIWGRGNPLPAYFTVKITENI
jgi:hypothetical protein